MAVLVTKEDFSKMVADLVKSSGNELTHIEALLVKLHEHKIQIEEFNYRSLLTQDLVDKLKTEGMKLNLLKKG